MRLVLMSGRVGDWVFMEAGKRSARESVLSESWTEWERSGSERVRSSLARMSSERDWLLVDERLEALGR